ncbi:hypothetical protein KY345_00415 [Candidatus Woesearchaeota archaeon]|nr:hypothetical protein [Candidatus Woesearchaeota archaeon]
MKRYIKSVYVEAFAITFIVLSAFAIIATATGFFYVRPVAESFAEKGPVPDGVYPAVYTALGVIIFYHVLLVLTSTCLLVLNQEKRV